MNIILSILIALLGVAVIGVIATIVSFALILRAIPIRDKYTNIDVGARNNEFHTEN